VSVTDAAGKPTRLVLINPNGTQVGLAGRFREREAALDMTGLPNANAAAPMIIEVHQQCEMGSWHPVGRTELPCWGP
jgi:hypothetical protein